MPTETTACLLLAPRQDHAWLADGFRPNYVLLLHEGFRAWWTAHPTGPDEDPQTRTIRPANPEWLLTSGLLGFLDITAPDLLAAVPSLAKLVHADHGDIVIDPLCRHRSADVLRLAMRVTEGVVTLLADPSIGTTELDWVRRRGMIVTGDFRGHPPVSPQGDRLGEVAR
jgi:hypothetical protein